MLKLMPELPEVETIRLGLAPLVADQRVAGITIREKRLRWPIAAGLEHRIAGQAIRSISRRAKYLLLELETQSLVIHLGMSGSLRYLEGPAQPLKHDHYDILLVGGALIRYNDPRRFGSLHLTPAPDTHPLLRELGPEPLGGEFTGEYLWRCSRGRKIGIKQLIMNSRIVVGVGNIYANEALYRAGIHPTRPAGRIARPRIDRLCAEIKAVLEDALSAGGTTLRDFVGSDGRPGYFRQSLNVYERDGFPCRRCGDTIRRRVIGQRASYYCRACQR
jgi:formamidopyrimidine-DNA glycosylase